LVSVLLFFVNVLIIIVPIAIVVIPRMNNPIELLAPPELMDMAKNIMPPGGLMEALKVDFVNYTYDAAAHTSVLTLALTNNLRFGLRLERLEADVRCSEHGYPLGSVGLAEPKRLNAGEKTLVQIIFRWNPEAEQHIRSMHAGEEAVDVDLVNVVVEIGGLIIEPSERMTITIPLPGGGP